MQFPLFFVSNRFDTIWNQKSFIKNPITNFDYSFWIASSFAQFQYTFVYFFFFKKDNLINLNKLKAKIRGREWKRSCWESEGRVSMTGLG